MDLQPPDFSSSTFLSGVNQPMGMTWLPDGRMLIIEKPGTIEITDPDDGSKTTETYMDITGQVNDGRERGLIDITLDPDFDQNGYVYVFYSNDAESTNRIARFTHQENGGGLQSAADPSSEFVVWEEDEPWQSCCHQGAGLDFGPDGKLWLTTGDDFEGGAVSQNLAKASGKVIRVNKDGTIPSDNPYVDDGDPNTLGEIWAYGVRNPFRAEWDLESERFFFGDVGGNSAPDYEEVNVATLDNPGANYGWPACEGTSKSNEDAPCDVTQTAPVYSYPHSEGNSITGGEVYRGQQFPDEYQGAYFFGDYAKDWIKYMTFDSNGDVASVNTFEDSADSVNAISVGPDGALYWTSISDGTITKVSYTGNQAPSIDSVSATPTSASSAPQTVDFSVSASDPEDDTLTYSWTFGDGSTASGTSPSHTYQSAGTYTAYVEVSDGTQTIESQPIEITIGEPPSVTVDTPQDGSLFRAGDTISFSASGSDTQDGTLGSDAFTWDVVFDHDPQEGATHTHPVLTDYTGATGSFEIPTSGHGYSTDTSYTLTVTATDSDGLSASDSVTIEPDKVDITFATDPNGLELSVDGIPVNDGTVIDTLVDFGHTVSAPTTQCLNGREYEFQGWSDGGAQTHTYTVPDSDATLTANYQDVGECSTPVTDGLVAQYEADQGLSTSNGQVTGWADQSGQGNDLTAVGDPTTTTAPSGLTAVSFDGSGDKLERTSTLNAFPSGNGDRTVVLVTKYESTGYGGFAFGDDDTNQAFGTVVDPSGDLMVQAWGSSNDFSSGVAGTGEGWLVQSATLESSSLTHYKNGQVVDSRSHSYATDLQQMVLGAEIDSNPYLDMEVAAVYVYDRALSDTERQEVEAYLQDKYLSQETTNQNPTAVDDSATVDAGGSTTVDVLANDDDPDGSLDTSTVTIDQAPTSGTATVNGDGTITYTHDGSDATSDSFVYQVSDDQGAGDAATVSVSIDQGATDSSLPVTSGLVTHFAADEGISTGAGDVLTGWADQSGQGNDLTATGDPLVKHDTLNGNQVLSFDGDGDALVRTDTLSGLPSGSADRTVMYVVNYQSSPSWGGGIDYGAASCNQAFGLIVHDSQLQVHGWCDDFTADTSADVGPDGWMTHSAVLASDQVTHYKNGTQIDQYTHTYDTNLQKLVIGAEIDEQPYVDMEVAEVVIYDRALSDTERQQVENYFDAKYFTQVQNAPPTASDDSASVTAGQSTTIDVLANDQDSDGTLDTSSVQVTSGPSTGTTTVENDGSITYSAPSGTSGDVTFTYSVADDDGATDTATVTVSVSADTGTGTYGVTTGDATNVVIDTSTATNAAATLSGSLALGDESEAQTYVRFWVQGQPETKYWYDGETLTASGDFSIDVVLSPSTTYVWQTLSESGDGAWKVGTEKTFTTPTGQFFGVDTTGASGVGVESATLNGEIINLGDNSDAQVYFTYWKQGQKDSTLTWYTGPVQDSAGAFSTEVGLEPGTTYEYRAFGQSNEGEWKAGPVTTFTTQTGDTYSVATQSATNVDSDSATLQGELTGLGDYDSATVYFQYWKQGQKSSTLTWWTGSSLSSPGQFGADVAGLDAETTYVFQAYAQSDTGKWTAGSEQTLTTTADGGTQAFAVNTEPATDVTDTSATLNAEVTGFGDADSIQKAHFQYWKKGQESSTKQWTTNQQLSDPGSYSADVTELTPETTYVARAHVQNSDGVWTDGGTVEFTTAAMGGTNPSIDLLSPTEGETITGDSVTVSWETQNMGETDHVHVYLDGANRQGSQPQDGSYTYTGVEPGEHNATVVAALSDHTEYTTPEAIETVNFTVEAGNAPPTANDDSASVTAGQSVSVDVLANDTDSDGTLDASSVEVTSGPTTGTTTVNADGTITYTAPTGASGDVTFTYSVADDDGATDTATVTVTVTQPTSSLPVTSGLVTHLEADQGVSTSGDTVTGWADQSGTGIDLSSAGDPTLVADGLNGNPVINLDGDGDKLVRTSDLTGLPSGAEDRTMFVVTKYDSTDAYVGAAFGNGDANQAFGTVVETGGDLTVQGWGNQNDLVSDVAGVGAGWLVQSAVVASDQVTHYKDGSQIDSGPQTYDTTLDATSSKFVIGEEINEIGYADMEIAAVVVYDRALTDSERQQVEDYLQDKYFGTQDTNQAPTATDDSASVTAGGSTTIDVLANDGDSDGSLDASSVQVTSEPSTGTATVNTDGTVTYNAPSGASGDVTFTYSVADDDGATATATVTVTISAANTAPSASDDSATVDAGQSVVVDVLANDADSDGSLDASSVQVTSAPSTGTTSVDSSTGEITYTHDGSDSTSDSFTYTVADDDGATSNEATVTVSVNQPPSAAFTPPSDPVAGTSASFDASGSSDSDGSIASYAWDFDGDGTVDQTATSPTITHTYSSSGEYTVELTVADDDGATDATTQTVSVAAANQAPTASDDSASVDAGQSVVVDVLANDEDSDGTLDASSVQVTSAPSTGSTSVDTTTGEITYTHDGSDSTSDSFTYTIADDDGATDTATVSITISQPTSSLPVTSGLVTHLEADQGVSTSGGQVSGWADQSGTGIDLTASGDPTTTTAPTGATAISLDGDGDKLVRTSDLTGLPSGSEDRTMFVVTKYDGANAWGGTAFGNGASNKMFGMAVKQGSGELIIQSYATDEVSTTQGIGAGWLVQSATVAGDQFTHYKNGSQIDSGSHTYDTVLDATSSKFVIGEEIAQAGYIDMEIAAVVVYDRALSDTERQEVEAYLQDKYFGTQDTNQAPTASDDSASVTAGQSTIIDVLANDEDSDGSLDTSSVQVTSGPSTGTATVESDGTITYDAPSEANGDVTFTYTVVDDDGATSNEATVTVTIEAANTAPTASDDSATVDAGQSVVVDVLANDGDSDGTLDASSVQVTSGPSSGSTAVDSSTGEITYTHDGSDSTADSLTYSVADDDGATDTATVSITVNQPTDLSLPVTSGLVTHFEAGQGVSTSGGAVTGWADQSGQGNDLTGVGDPTLVADALNGNPVVSLDGTDDVLQRTDTLSGLPSGNDNRTVMYVVNYQSSPNFGGGVAYGAAACSQTFGLIVHSSNLWVQGWCDDFGSGTSADVGPDGWMTHSAVLASDQVTHYKDGTQIDQYTHTYDTDPQKLVIGAEVDGAPQVDMEVAEVVIYDRALTDTERQQVEDYLQQKYGLDS